MPKSALIMMGGAMRSSYGGGFLFALRKEYGVIPDIVIGTSGNAANACYFATGQTDAIRHLWCDALPRSDVVNPLRFWRMFDVDRMIEMLKKEAPLDTRVFSDGTIKVLIPITDAETGESRYLSPSDVDDAYELLRAAKAIPVFYRRRVMLGGRPYIDGEAGPTLNDHVRAAEEQGATRILVMNNGWPDNAFRHALKHLVARMEPHQLRDRMERDFDTNGFVCVTGETGVRIVCIFPQDIPARFIEWKQERLCASFEAGIRCARERESDVRTTFLHG